MPTNANTKIFIDTNIFLDFYRSNTVKDIQLLMSTLFMNYDSLLSTEQSSNEFLRNRARTLNDFLVDFRAKSKTVNHTSSAIRAMDEFARHQEIVKELNRSYQVIIKKMEDMIADIQKDEIYQKYKDLHKRVKTIPITDEILAVAWNRKISGNPPTSDKYTCGDEIIWESLLAYGSNSHCNLIIVSGDGTFTQNADFLKNEYRTKTKGKLDLCPNIADALFQIGIELPQTVINAADNIRWTDIIVQAFKNLGGQASLKELCSEIKDIVFFCYPDKQRNNAKEATIRGVLQRFSSDFPNFYNGKIDLFHRAGRGIWELRQ